jgi:uncharacterized membrane protein (DUF4010 family)
VTVSFTRRSARQPALARPLAAAVMLAWTVMFGRVAIGLLAVNRGLLVPLWPCIAAGAAASALSYVFLSRGRGAEAPAGAHGISNPFEMGIALRFGLLFAAVLLVSRAALIAVGDRGLLATGFISGLADVDAVLLSAGTLAGTPGGPAPGLAADAIALALIANTLAKGAVALLAGSGAFRRRMAPGFAVTLAALAAARFLI